VTAPPAPVVAEPIVAKPASEGFDAPKKKPISVSGRYAAPPAVMSDRTDLKDLVASQRTLANAGASPTADAKKAEMPYAPRYEDVKSGKSAIQPGTQGPAVKKVQDELAMAGYDVPSDGKFDDKTKAAVREYQAAHGLKPDFNHPAGWVDPKTLNTLETDMAARRAAAAAQPSGPDRKTVVDVARSPGFNKLNNSEREQLLKTLSSRDAEGALARSEVHRLVLDKGYQTETPDAQAASLKDFVTRGGHVPGNSLAPDGTYANRAVPHSVALKDDLGKGWQVHELTIDNRKIPINLESTGKNGATSVEEAAKAIASLPKADRDRIKSVMITDQNHNKGADTLAVANTKTGNVTFFNNPANHNPDTLASTLQHEVGHLKSNEAFGPDGDPKWKTWEKAIADDGLPPSRYARANPDEDFSETYALYKRVKGTPDEAAARAKYPARFKALDDIGD